MKQTKMRTDDGRVVVATRPGLAVDADKVVALQTAVEEAARGFGPATDRFDDVLTLEAVKSRLRVLEAVEANNEQVDPPIALAVTLEEADVLGVELFQPRR